MLTNRFAAASETEREFADGDFIVRKGEPGQEMFIIQSGNVSVRSGSGTEVARLGKGEFFGEMSVLELSPRNTDVIAQGTTRVLVLGPGALFVRLRRDPSFALELLQALSSPRATERAPRRVILTAAEERVVIVSDLHLGSPASHAEQTFAAFLEEVAVSGYALCINGDGFDLLQSTSPRLAVAGFPMLQRLQRLAADGLPIYYVLGNHDLALEHVLFDLPFVVSPFLNLVSGDQRIRIEHGHVHDPVYARMPRLYEFGGRIGRFALLTHADVYGFYSRTQLRLDDWRRRPGRARPYPHYAAALDLFHRGFDAAVFGHTHIPELTDLDRGTFANSGDWVVNRTCVTIDDGRIALHEWEPGLLRAE